MESENKRKKKIVIIIAAIIAVLAAVILVLYFRSQIRATTMRILRMEGGVELEENGKKKTATESLRLNSGNALSTAIKSLVSIGLDDTKIVTLVELSRAEFNQAGRQLDLNLTDGSLFFEVQKALEDDETMDIRTSTMIVGIRGTSGWVSVEGDNESVIISDGHVHIIGKNPTTGETKEIEVYSGQRVSTYLYNDRSVDSIMFYVEDVTEHDLPEAMLERFREDEELLDRVVTETGWDKPWILGMEAKTLVAEPTPSPEPVDRDENKDDSDTEPTLTPTPTPTPTKPVQKNEQEELEKLLAEMLAMMTPTPTPTPTPVITQTAPYEDPYGDEEEEEEDDEDDELTPTPTPTKAASSGVEFVDTGGYVSFYYPPANQQISVQYLQNFEAPSGSGIYRNMITLDSNDITLDLKNYPITIKDSSGNVLNKIENLNQITWEARFDNTTVTDKNGNRVQYRNLSPATPPDEFTMYDASTGTTTVTDDMNGTFYTWIDSL